MTQFSKDHPTRKLDCELVVNIGGVDSVTGELVYLDEDEVVVSSRELSES